VHWNSSRNLVGQLWYNMCMAINPRCDMCGNELKEFGAIVLSPPDEQSRVDKFHVCVYCYAGLAAKMKSLFK